MTFQMSSRGALLPLASLVIIAVVVVFFLVPPQASSQAASSDDKKAMSEEVRLIQSLKGETLFQAYCASCHGKDAKGSGPTATVLKMKPADLTRISQRSGGKFPSDLIQKIIAGNDPVNPAHGSREMPVWGPIFSQIAWDQDLGRVRIYNLAKYLESLQKK
jgi:mono/diheme cytochrome c family protein